MSSASDNWYTPPDILARVARTLDGIDLDPAADPARRVQAARHFTREDDGLSRDWSGRVFLNPPYGRAIGAWIAKLASEYRRGCTTQAIALLPARVDTAWWRLIAPHHVCFLHGRLRFSGAATGAPFPSAVVLLSRSPYTLIAFGRQFGPIGSLYAPMETE